MELYPAIDLRGGRCVRLWQGDFDKETVYGTDPIAVAERFVAAGARWLHIVDLDAARGEGTNLDTVDPDMRWAAAIAAFAEILKGSPFADRANLPLIESVVAQQAARDQDRMEFASLFTRAKGLLATR